MSWFSRKPPRPAIPRYPPEEPILEKRPEPMVVDEVRDPTESMIIRIKDMIRIRFRGD